LPCHKFALRAGEQPAALLDPKNLDEASREKPKFAASCKVRYWDIADIETAPFNVRFWGDFGHQREAA